jgi:hypothetical protein
MSRNKGAKTKRLNGTLGRKNTAPNKVGALIMNAFAVTGKLVLGTTYKLESASDILNVLGVDAAYDTTNKVLVYHHLSRFFKRNPGSTLYVFFVPQKVSTDHITLDTICDVANPTYLTKFLTDVKASLQVGGSSIILSLGVCANPHTTYTKTVVTGMDTPVLAAIPKLQANLAVFEDDYFFVNAWLEGRGFTGVITDLLSLRSLTGVLAARVSVVIAADPIISGLGAANTQAADYAAIGDVVGLDTLAALSQNVGEAVQAFNLQDAASNSFMSAGVSGNFLVSSFTSDQLNSLDTKGYIFCETLAGYAGVYISDSHTCVAITDDYGYKENNYVIDKAQLLRRGALIPLTTNARLQADTSTGELSAAAKAGIQNAVNKAIEDNMAADISGAVDSFIPAGINVLSGDPIDVECSFVPLVIGRLVTINSGFKNPAA